MEEPNSQCPEGPCSRKRKRHDRRLDALVRGEKLTSGLWKSDVIVRDRQNVDAAIRILQPKVRQCLQDWDEQRTEATRVYLKIGHNLIRSYTDENFRGTQRIVSVNYLFGRPLIPSDFLERIVTSNSREMTSLMSVVFGLLKMSFGYRKKVSYQFRKGDKT